MMMMMYGKVEKWKSFFLPMAVTFEQEMETSYE